MHEPRTGRRARGWIASALAALLCASCRTTYKEVDPTLLVRGSEGSELGVGTEYGVVFLGHSGRAGEVDITAWFGDGPSIESSLVEAIGGGLYTAETEILLPSVALSFSEPPAGTTLWVRGRRGAEVWTAEARVVRDAAVEGLLLTIPDELEGRPEQIGAGVFLPGISENEGLRLLGLVSGTLELERGGQTRRYLTVAGPRDLWRLVALRRDLSHKRHWAYREDVL